MPAEHSQSDSASREENIAFDIQPNGFPNRPRLLINLAQHLMRKRTDLSYRTAQHTARLGRQRSLSHKRGNLPLSECTWQENTAQYLVVKRFNSIAGRFFIHF